MLNEFSRTQMLIGKEGLKKLNQSKVAVFGIGGVGSFTVEALVRAGLGRIVLVDDDCVCVTNINRQIHATQKTIGQPKVQVMKERIHQINPAVEVTTYQIFYPPEDDRELIGPDLDYIVDAVDTVTAKLHLVMKALSMNIPIISCMGTGNKLNPGMLEIADIYATSVCPLAKVMRKELKKRQVPGLKVVYSKEPPVKPWAACDSEEVSVAEKCNTMRQVPGSISFVPSTAGLLIAGEVVNNLIGSLRSD